MIMSVENKVVVITGGSSGIGEATAKLALTKGAKVVVGSRNEEKLERMADEVDHPENFAYKLTDVTKKDQVQALVDLAIDKFGKLDVIYNNAGIMPQGPVDDPNKLSEWQAILDTNIMGVLNGIVAAVPQMKKQGHGLIMATDSVAGHVVYPGSAVYNGSKYAVKAIMEGLRQEQHKNGIKTGVVSPGSVNTNLMSTIHDDTIRKGIEDTSNSTKNGWLSSEDIAELAVFMMSQPENVDINEILVRPTDQDI
ncbi:short-chain dehydrogenase oxidoreductase [Fructilactobacillus fructivorans]|nr:short-chain dehydrogenase oxidoreductase [Fructilactobacillus fructivorans]